MEKWKYLILTENGGVLGGISGYLDGHEVAEDFLINRPMEFVLNQLGGYGWELVGVEDNPNRKEIKKLYLKRKIS